MLVFICFRWYPEATKNMTSDSIHGESVVPGHPYYPEESLYGCGPHLFQGAKVDFRSEQLRWHFKRQPAWARSSNASVADYLAPLLNSAVTFTIIGLPSDLELLKNYSFIIQARNLPPGALPSAPFVLSARARGSKGIIHIPLIRHGHNRTLDFSTYEFEGNIQLFHEGAYFLEIFLSWLYESISTGHWEDDGPLYVGQLLIQEPINGIEGNAPAVQLCNKPICAPSNLKTRLPGRWMAASLLKECGSDYEALNINDELGYNSGLVYVPDACNFDVPSAPEFYDRCAALKVSSWNHQRPRR